MRVLIIEDSVQIISSITCQFEGTDVKVDVSNSGMNGLKKTEEILPDLIIIDIMLPKLDGIQVLRELSSDAATRNIPIIIMSVVESPGDPGILRLGAVGFFKKPVDFAELGQKLKKISKGSRMLVAEDNAEILRHMKMGIKSLGYEVLSLQEGEDVIVSAKESRPDIILLDVLLPNEDGLAVLRKLKREDETYAIPVILFSGYFSSGIELDEIAGAERFREKDFSVDDMAGEIKKIVFGYRENI